MKILCISAQKPHSTGSGTYLTEMVNSMDRLGHEQAVIAGVYKEDVVSFPEGVSFYPVYFSEDFPIYGMSDVMPYPSSLYSSMSDEDTARFTGMFEEQLQKVVESFDPDIIYCHHLFLLTAIVKELFPERVVFGQCHGSDLRQFKTCKFMQDRIRKGIQSLNKIFALHGEQKEEIISLYQVPADKVEVLGSGYNTRLFNTDSRKKRSASDSISIIYAGKLSKPKGVPELFEAIKLLSDDESMPKFKLLLAGGCQDDEVRAKLDSLISEYGNGKGRCESVSYLGLLKQTKLAEEFKTADVFVLPSYFEGLGLVLIEAMASGLVPVATRLPGIKEWIDASIDGSNAIFVKQPDMETIDKPFDYALPEFTQNLANAINEASALCIRGFDQPDTSRIGWDSIAFQFLHTDFI